MPISPPSAPASAKTCWPRLRRISPASKLPPTANAIRCAVPPRSRLRGAACSTPKKHFDLNITGDAFSFARTTAEIAAEAATDGLYVGRTSLPTETLSDADSVRSYKSLARVERACRCIKTVDLHVRPVYHWLEERVRAHGLLGMMASYREWHMLEGHMRQGLALMLFDDTDKEAAEALPRSVVAPAQRSK